MKPRMGLKRGRQIVYDSEEDEDSNSKRAKHSGDKYKLFNIMFDSLLQFILIIYNYR